MKGIAKFILMISLIVGFGASCTDNDGMQSQARRILDTTGIEGGLVVHVGCGSGKLTTALRADESFVVHGLEGDSDEVGKARQYIHSKNLYGPVSVEHWEGSDLPYTNNLVNLLVVEEDQDIAESEMMRVLAPRGVAYVKQGGEWHKKVKPTPEDIDEWTHYLHGPDNNAVARDEVVGPPKHVQWISGPPHARSHEFNISLGGKVTAGGRLFYIWDEGPIGVVDKRMPEQWKLIARDAFNGKLLWKQPMPEWGWRQWHDKNIWEKDRRRAQMLRLIPATLPRRLVADSGRVYVTLGYHAPVSVLDAATGEKIRDFEQTALTDEILLSGDTLVLNLRSKESPPETDVWDDFPGVAPEEATPKQSGQLMAVDTKTGETLWQSEKTEMAPLTLSVRDGQVYYSNYDQVVCLDLESGNRLWKSDSLPSIKPVYRATCGTLVPRDEVVLYSYPEGKPDEVVKNGYKVNMVGLSPETGEILWEGPKYFPANWTNPPDLFVADGLVWQGKNTNNTQETKVERKGFDPVNGEVQRKISVPYLRSAGHHWRCYRSKATERYQILPKRGAEYLDLKGDNHSRNDWVRPPCKYGVLPANGLTYFAPHPCVCYPGVLLNNFNALAPARPESFGKDESIPGEDRLQKGPAWKQVERPGDSWRKQHAEDWPMFRHDPKRSGSTPVTVPADIEQQWKISLDGEITPPVVADGRLLVAEKNAHTVHALDPESGEQIWNFTAGGRIDSPPAVYGQLVLFGSADGYVYCVRASDGALVWRFMAAPQNHRVLAYGQIESAWPVHGSVLVQKDTTSDSSRPVVYFTAGRSSFLDGGMRIYGLNPYTGEVLHQNRLEGPYPDPYGKPSRAAFNMDGAKSGILAGDGSSNLYLYQNGFKSDLTRDSTPAEHLISIGGFLDHTYKEGFYWSYRMNWPGTQRHLLGHSQYAQLLVFNNKAVFGNHVMTENIRVRRGFTPGEGERLFARKHGVSKDRWAKKIPIRIRGMVLAGENLFVSGAPDKVPEDDPLASYEGRAGAFLVAVSSKKGEKLSKELNLESPPVFDGLIAAQKRLYMSNTKGEVLCFGK